MTKKTEEIKTVRQMIAYLRQKLEDLGFVMPYLSFHPADGEGWHLDPQPLVYHIVTLAGYHPGKALIVGVHFRGGSDGLSIFSPGIELLGELKPRENVYPGDIHQELEEFGLPCGTIPHFTLMLDERTIENRKKHTTYIDEACRRMRRLIYKTYKDVIADSFTSPLFSFQGFVPTYSDEHRRRYSYREQHLETVGIKWTDRPYIWAALQTFPEGYIAYNLK